MPPGGGGDVAARMEALAVQAAAGTIGPDDLAGATFTVSNLGMFEVDDFSAILNPPHGTILAIGAAKLAATATWTTSSSPARPVTW